MSVEALESRVLLAGRVDFVPYYETGSSWWDPVHGPAYRQSMEDMLGQFEAVLRTSGTWDASIEVFFKEDGTTAYASTSNANYANVTHLGSTYRAVGAWREIVQGAADDNGTTVNLTNGDGSETEIDWNFSLSTPDRNPGLLRHELLHSLGMTSYLSDEMPTMAQDGSITKNNVGGVTPAFVYDSRIVDLNRNAVLGGHVSGINYTVNNYAVDNNWDDQNGSGLAFHAIADDGGDLYFELTSWNSDGVRNGTGIGTQVGSVQSSHPLDVSYAYAHPTWNTLVEVDRAVLRAMGYTIAPVVVADAITVAEGGTATALVGGATSVLANDTDADLPNDTLTVSTTPVVAPLHGTLTLHADGTFQYVHDGSENFVDSFTYRVSDAASHTAQAAVTITVTPVNDNTPVAVADAITVAEGGTATVLVGGATSVLANDTDVDLPNDLLTVNTTPVVAPLHGTLTVHADGTFQYVHDGSENFADSFIYRVSDATSRRAQAVVTITVLAPTWQNSRHPCDVTGDGYIGPIDVLTLITDINRWGARELSTAVPPTPASPPFLDPTGDGRIGSVDVLTVISDIDTYGARPVPTASGGEGEYDGRIDCFGFVAARFASATNLAAGFDFSSSAVVVSSFVQQPLWPTSVMPTSKTVADVTLSRAAVDKLLGHDGETCELEDMIYAIAGDVAAAVNSRLGV